MDERLILLIILFVITTSKFAPNPNPLFNTASCLCRSTIAGNIEVVSAVVFITDTPVISPFVPTDVIDKSKSCLTLVSVRSP